MKVGSISVKNDEISGVRGIQRNEVLAMFHTKLPF